MNLGIKHIPLRFNTCFSIHWLEFNEMQIISCCAVWNLWCDWLTALQLQICMNVDVTQQRTRLENRLCVFYCNTISLLFHPFSLSARNGQNYNIMERKVHLHVSSQTTRLISIKSGVRYLYWKLSVKLNLGSYSLNIRNILLQTYIFSQKGIIVQKSVRYMWLTIFYLKLFFGMANI